MGIQMPGNEVLWAILLFVNFVCIVTVHRFWGRTGLYVWVAIAAITANIQVTKTIDLFGLTATLGNVVYAGTFLVTDILNERYGKAAARRAVVFGFLAIITHTILMNMALWFEPDASDSVHPHLAAIFGILPRISVASLGAYLVSQLHDVWAFQFWRKRFPKHLWVRNNLSTATSQLIDSVAFTLVAFVGVFPPNVLAEIVLTTYVLKLVVAVVDTPFVYIGTRWAVGVGKQGGQDADKAPATGKAASDTAPTPEPIITPEDTGGPEDTGTVQENPKIE